MKESGRRRIPWDDYLAMHAREIGLAVLTVVAIALTVLYVFIPPGDELAGSVTSGGRPVVYGTVTVVASDDRVYTAPIRADGTYRIPSVPPGPVRVAVSSANPRSIVEQMGAAEASSTPSPTQSAGAVPRGGAGRGPGNGERNGSGGTSAANAPANGATRPKGTKDDPAVETVSVASNATTLPFPVPAKSRQQDRQEGWFRIPGRYASPATSGIRTEVRRGRTPLDIRLDY